MATETLGTDGRKIARKSIYGIFWNYASFGLGKILVFVTTAILARLLTPNDFGIVAFATLTTEYLSILKDLGLGVALIQHRQDVEESANTVFTLNLLLGGVLTVTGIVIAPFVAIFFGESLVTPVLSWLSLTFVLNALGSVHLVRLQRELEFRRKLIPDLARSLFKGVISIGLALAGFGVWSLVIGQLAGVLAGVIFAWIVFPWRPRLTINTRLARRFLGYGLSVMGVNGLTTITDNFDYLIIGYVFGNTALGVYTLAFRLPELLVLTPLWMIGSVTFSAYATVQDQLTTLRQGFLVTIRFVGILSVPLSVGLMLVADPIIRVVFGEQWLEAIPVVRVLALFVLIRSISFNSGDIYKAIGRPGILVKLELLNGAVLIPALLVGSYFGLVGVAWGHVAASLLRLIADLIVAHRFLEASWKEILLQLKPSFLGGLALVALVWPSLYLTAANPPWVCLIIAIMGGAAAYLSLLGAIERESLLQVGSLMGIPGLNRKPVSSSLAFTASSEAEAN